LPAKKKTAPAKKPAQHSLSQRSVGALPAKKMLAKAKARKKK
jgi:hypothetical protein